jgi:hypothetical protein
MTHQGIAQEVAAMRSIMPCLLSRLSRPGFEMGAQQALGPAPLAAVAPRSMADPGAVDVGLMPVVVAVALLVLVLWSAWILYDRGRKRAEEAAALQARISDALMVERSLSGFPLTFTVRMPLWGRGPVVVALTGVVSRPALRQAAIDLVLREVESTGRACVLQDRIAVAPVRLGRAA